jgi:DNA repair protein RecO (recombination protein O)
MLVKTAGIVLRTLKYRDNSLIVDIYTEVLGLRSYMVQGIYAKKGTSTIAYFQPLSTLDLVVYEREDKNLQRIKELKLKQSPLVQPFDMTKSSLFLFCADILRQILKERAGEENLYKIVNSTLYELQETKENLTCFPQYLLLSLTPELGIVPQGEYSTHNPYLDMREGLFVNQEPLHPDYMSPEISQLSSKLLQNPTAYSKIVAPREIRNIWLHKLLRYYEIHLNHFYELKSLPILSQVLIDTH